MSRIIKVVVLAAVLGLGSLAIAQESEIPMSTVYDRTQALPDGIAFQTTVNILADWVESGDREYAVGWVGERLDMDSREADVFLNTLLVAQQGMKTEVARSQATHACSSGDAYKILDELYDVEEQVTEQFYNEVRASLDGNTKILFENWLAQGKSSITYSRVDFEKADQLRGTDSTKTVTDLCQGAE